MINSVFLPGPKFQSSYQRGDILVTELCRLLESYSATDAALSLSIQNADVLN
jgi:hypothetical protein